MPHQKITQAALDSLPRRVLSRFGAETGKLATLYCLYPDRYAEMLQFGFVRKSEGPRSAEEIRRYCVRPDGQSVHGATGDRETDLESMIFLFERILSSFSARRPGEAAKYAGVLAHFIEDSLSPPHAAEIEAGAHAALERSVPEFTLAGRVPHAGPGNLLQTAEALLDRIYAVRERNRQDLPEMIKAVASHEDQALDTYRRRAAVAAAEILADALAAVTAGLPEAAILPPDLRAQYSF